MLVVRAEVNALGRASRASSQRSHLGEGVTSKQLTQFIDNNSVSSSAWELVRHQVVTGYAFKVGDTPGVVLFLEVDSPGAAFDVVNGLPAARRV